MEHLVRFQTAEGREGHHTAESLDDALRFVERLRNAEETSEVRVYRMSEVPIEFRTYYKVELRTGDLAAAGEEAAEGGGDGGALSEQPGSRPLVATGNGVGDGDHGEGGGRRLFGRG